MHEVALYPLHQLIFSFHEPPTPERYTLSLHDALPIYPGRVPGRRQAGDTEARIGAVDERLGALDADRKSTRLNSSHVSISYAVFCLKKKKRCNRCIQHDLLFTPPLLNM